MFDYNVMARKQKQKWENTREKVKKKSEKSEKI